MIDGAEGGLRRIGLEPILLVQEPNLPLFALKEDHKRIGSRECISTPESSSVQACTQNIELSFQDWKLLQRVNRTVSIPQLKVY